MAELKVFGKELDFHGGNERLVPFAPGTQLRGYATSYMDWTISREWRKPGVITVFEDRVELVRDDKRDYTSDEDKDVYKTPEDFRKSQLIYHVDPKAVFDNGEIEWRVPVGFIVCLTDENGEQMEEAAEVPTQERAVITATENHDVGIREVVSDNFLV